MARKALGSEQLLAVNTEELKKVGNDLSKVGPIIRKQLRLRMKIAGEIVRDAARANIAPHSHKIGGSIALGASVTKKGGASIKVTTGGPKAPNGAPFENRGRPGYFRHPVFFRDENGNVVKGQRVTVRDETGKRRSNIFYASTTGDTILKIGKGSTTQSFQVQGATWVDQEAHPHLLPALVETADRVTDGVTKAVEATLTELDFH